MGSSCVAVRARFGEGPDGGRHGRHAHPGRFNPSPPLVADVRGEWSDARDRRRTQ
ncbi:hypothetical protein Ae168Ps1_5871 [Pseudonocardia sp. Ae168_Ps1]|nr:hypothetical protein Ae168Ps1_5871 [Pseudonocardia sp. Ae168_Ps1]OLL77084.1 hypothetical protein Ae150APs1_5462c [Pseudonocardia sp. Ae150A_Ps1]OLL88805.1 hypothetical protein Ae263Ps1_5860 [Pseudonocardia sp. Ae263_Ps1]OLL91169.1 hypothetical protein Ae356Ps1_1066c [Pseudonocardia sp. Ae356_Ps1]